MYCYWTCALLIVCAKLTHGELSQNTNLKKEEGRTDSFITSETDRGKYFRFMTGDGILQEQAIVIKDNNNNSIFEVHAHINYQTPDGKVIDKWYRADEDGIEYIAPPLRTRVGSDVIQSLIGGGVG